MKMAAAIPFLKGNGRRFALILLPINRQKAGAL